MTARPFRFAAALAVLTSGAFAGACGGGGAASDGGATAGGSGGGTAGAGTSGGGGVTTNGGAGGGAAGNQAGLSGAAGSAPDASVAAEGGTGDAAGALGAAPLTQFLRIIQVTTVQGTQTVSISIDGQKNHNGAIHAAQALTMRIHVRPDTGWVAHPTVAELHLTNPSMDVILSATRTITGASSAAILDSTFNFDLTAAQVTKDLRFEVALRDPAGVAADPPPAIQRALYPRDGTLDTLDAQ